jgi:hypothetical protein
MWDIFLGQDSFIYFASLACISIVTIDNAILSVEVSDAISSVGFLPVLPEVVALFAEAIFEPIEVFALSVGDVVEFVVSILISTHNMHWSEKYYDVAATFRYD